MLRLFFVFTCLFFPFLSKASLCSKLQGQAIVVMYHQFDGLHPSTSVTTDQFISHLNYFLSSGFKIISLEKLMYYIKSKKAIPDKTVVITIDDAYASVYKKAHPLFLKYKIPYTLFVNTEGVDKGYKAYMTWDQLREVSKSGLASLQAHSHSHGHLIRTFTSEQRKKDVLFSVQRIYEETGVMAKYFAYPYGETHLQFMQELKNYRMILDGKTFKFEAAFSTQSGPVGCSSSLFALPRFALNINYGKLGPAFYTKMNSLHLPILDYIPENPAICSYEQRKQFSFKLHPSFKFKYVNCFPSQGQATAQYNSRTHSVDIELQGGGFGSHTYSIFDPRERLNCTMLGKDGRYYWLGREFSILKCL